jgi:hypothetical protein
MWQISQVTVVQGFGEAISDLFFLRGEPVQQVVTESS